MALQYVLIMCPDFNTMCSEVHAHLLLSGSADKMQMQNYGLRNKNLEMVANNCLATQQIRSSTAQHAEPPLPSFK